jgi:hypothetical protein
MGAFAAIGAPLDAYDRGHGGWLPGGARLTDGLEKPLDLAAIHTLTMAQGAGGNNQLCRRALLRIS